MDHMVGLPSLCASFIEKVHNLNRSSISVLFSLFLVIYWPLYLQPALITVVFHPRPSSDQLQWIANDRRTCSLIGLLNN